MAFDGTEGSAIDLSVASEWTANFRANYPDKIKAFFFGKDILEEILAQDGCMGIRIFYAIDGEGGDRLILSGADHEENDQLTGTLAEYATPCPSRCGSANSLNSDS